MVAVEIPRHDGTKLAEDALSMFFLEKVRKDCTIKN